MTGANPATVMVSLTFSSFIVKSLVNVSPMAIVRFRVSAVAKPCSSTFSENVPGASAGNR